MREAVRSGRRANFFITENSFIDHYAREVGTTGVAVYHVLERHANCETRSTWIGTAKMAELLNLDQRTIQRTIKKLESLRLIRVVRSSHMTTFFVVPVPPPAKTTSTPLFDEVPFSAEDDADVADATPVSHSTTGLSRQPTWASGQATHVPLSSDICVAAYKEEQDAFNKTHEQNEKGNKTDTAAQISESAERLVAFLQLPEDSKPKARLAVEAEMARTGLSAKDVVPRIRTAWNTALRGANPGRSGRGRFLDEFPAQVAAEELIENLSLTYSERLVATVTKAIVAEAQYSGLCVQDAAVSIAKAASEDRENGMPIDKFYFEDTKWRTNGRINKAEQRKINNLAANARAKEILRGLR